MIFFFCIFFYKIFILTKVMAIWFFMCVNWDAPNIFLWINLSCKQLSPRQEQRADGYYRSYSSQTPWEAFLRMPMAKQHYDTFSRPTILGNTKLMDIFFQSSWELGSLVFRALVTNLISCSESIGRQQSHHNRHSALYCGVGTAGSLRILFAASTTLDISDYG